MCLTFTFLQTIRICFTLILIYLAVLESVVNYNLKMVSDWLMANKVSLNIDKTNFIIFHSPQKVKGHRVKLIISNREIMQEKFIKYLGLLIDSHLSWKYHILHISKKIKRCIGILSKIRHSVTNQVLIQMNKGWKFLKKLWCCVGGGNKVIWL